MPTWLATDIADLDNATWEARQKNIMVDIATDLQDFPGAARLLNKEKVNFDGGDQYEYPLLTDGDDNWGTIGFFETDDLSQNDAALTGVVGWKWSRTGCHYDRKQLAVNSGAARKYNFLKKIEYQMWLDYWAGMEQQYWFGPTSSTDTKSMFGILGYWLSYHASSGFNGGNHTNFSSGPGGQSRTTYPNHKNYTFNYAAMSEADGYADLREAYELTKFKGIPNRPIKDIGPPEHRYGIYTTYATLKETQDLLDSKNQNIGSDLGKYEGSVMFRRTPVEWVPFLQENHATSDPIIGIDHNDLRVVCPNKSEWMRRDPYHRPGDQGEVRQTWVVTSANLAMHQCRRHFLGAKSDPMSD